MYYAIILVFLIFSTSCTRNTVDGFDREVTLKVGQQTSVDRGNLLISLKELAEDSRCPLGVVCIWAGNGAVVLKLQTADQVEVDVTLNTGLKPQKVIFEEYEIALKELEPYPVENVVVDPNDYKATLSIAKI